MAWEGSQKSEMKEKKREERREHGVEVRRRREGGRWGRSVKSHGQRQTKEGGEKCTHLPYPADRRKLNQAEVSSGSSEGRKSMRKCWNNGGIVIKDEEEEWKLKRYMKYEIQDSRLDGGKNLL